MKHLAPEPVPGHLFRTRRTRRHWNTQTPRDTGAPQPHQNPPDAVGRRTSQEHHLPQIQSRQNLIKHFSCFKTGDPQIGLVSFWLPRENHSKRATMQERTPRVFWVSRLRVASRATRISRTQFFLIIHAPLIQPAPKGFCIRGEGEGVLVLEGWRGEGGGEGGEGVGEVGGGRWRGGGGGVRGGAPVYSQKGRIRGLGVLAVHRADATQHLQGFLVEATVQEPHGALLRSE